MELFIKARSGRPRRWNGLRPVQKCSEEPVWAAKELQSREPGTGLAFHWTTIQMILNNKDLHGKVARKKPSL